jgi:hypothetical protein
MTPQSIINQNEARNRSVGSNPTPSECYHYNDLRRNGNTAVITEPKKPHYQQLNLNSRGGYDLTAEAFIYHPNPAVCRMWHAQHEASK